MLLMTCLIILSPAVAGVITYPTLKLDFSAELPWLGIAFTPWRLLAVILALPSGLGALALYFFFESPKFLYVITYPTLKLDFSAELPWLGIAFTPWRLLAVILALPSGLGALALYFFFESPKFLYGRGRKEEALDVSTISSEDVIVKKPMSLPRAMFELSSCLFRPPYLNNSFLVWLPHIMNLVRVSLENNLTNHGSVCSLISTQVKHTAENVTVPTSVTPEICVGTIEDNVIFTLIASQSIFSFLNFVISCLPNRKKAVLITILCLSSLSGASINLMPEPISSVFMFMMFTCTCLGMGILASYFVELYPTSY
ncbi:putative SV2-like protein 1, partial [Operophtera brumata]